ncbi:MAG: type IX secretion system outer membrane channel protein PorV [Bacteroidetes bacterium]|nr:type IX secretion system outer membrane channel protein PorV [Bacteroidota bacterium]
MKFIIKNLLFAFVIFALVQNTFAQFTYNDLISKLIGQDGGRVITTAVPLLLIAPDSRSGAMGDAGVASSPDASSMHWNPAKYAFAEKDFSIAISYSPWLRELVNDINLAYLSGYKRIDKMSTFGVSLLYFSLGDITFTDVVGNSLGNYRPSEFALDACYSRKLSDNFSGAIAARYINSNLTQGQSVNGQESHAGQSVAADIAVFYQKPMNFGQGLKGTIAFGANISNLGAKISYTETTERDFLPTNLRLGTCVTLNIDEFNKLSFMVDFNKLLVPTPPIYRPNYTGNGDSVINGQKQILSGKDPNVGIVTGLFQSFTDAPNGLREEIQEITYSIGTEYWYDNQFAIRAGYFHESMWKGNRQFFTLGAGLRYNVFGLDFAYLIPTEQRNPLANTLRFTLTFDFDAFKDQNKAPK